MMKVGLKRRFAFSVLLVFLTANLISLSIMGRIADGIVSRLGSGLSEQQALTARARGLAPLLGEISLARKMADSPLLREWAKDEDAPVLRRQAMAEMESYRRAFGGKRFFVALAPSSHYYYGDTAAGAELRYTIDPAKPEDAWFAATMSAGRDVQINVNHDAHLGVTMVWINAMMQDEDGRALGVIGTGVDLATFVRDTVAGEIGTDTMLVDGAGDIQAHRDVTRIDFASLTRDQHATVLAMLDDATERGHLQAMISAASKSNEGGQVVASVSGRRQIISVAPLPEIGWAVVTMVDRDILSGRGWFQSVGLLMVVTAIVIVLSVLYLLDRWVLARLRRLDSVVAGVSAGHYDVEAPIEYDVEAPIEYDDEIARLGATLARMATIVGEHAQSLEQTSAAAVSYSAQTDERFRSLVESTSDWVWETDDQHRFTWISPSISTATGLSADDLTGRRRWDLAAEGREVDTDAWRDYIADMRAMRPFRDFRYWLHTANGGACWVSVSGSPRFTADGHFLGYRGVGSDITASADSAFRLRMLSKVVDQIPVSVVITDTNAVIQYVNEKSQEITGYTAAELVGRKPSLFASGDTPVETYKTMWTTLAAGGVWVGELRNVRKDGALYWERVRISPIHNSDGVVAQYVAVKEDITFRKEAEAELAEAHRNLEEQAVLLTRSNAELEQFAYVASHDLRQPLRMVTSYMGLLARHLGKDIDKDAEEYMGFAVDGAKRMDRLILALLEYSRVGRETMVVVPVSLSEVVGDALLNLKMAAVDVKATVTVADGLPTVAGDHGELTRLFQNLVGNALKYVAPNRSPVIDIGWRTEGGEVVVWVRDNGIGIRQEDRERAFGMFQRLVTRDAYEGTGIGLAVCKKITERHNGRIWIEDTPGGGTTFLVAFPSI